MKEQKENQKIWRENNREHSRQWKRKYMLLKSARKTYKWAILKWRKANPFRYAAHQAVQYGLRIGKIIRPSVCSRCWLSRKTEAHHEDYEKPLEVFWICKKCHSEIHKNKS